MSNSLAEMFVALKPDGKTFQPEADRIIRRTKLDRSGRSLGLGLSKSIGGGMRIGLGGALKSAFGPVAAIAGGLGLASFFKDAVSGASDLNETLSKSASVFGPANREILRFASTSAAALGQSKQEATAAAAQFGNMFNQLGIGQKPAAKMSIQMVKLASDFASFHNADITEVLEAQQAAFRGEFDSVQKFVPTINAAAVEQEGLRLKLAGSSKELTAQDKALATQSLLMKGAGKATGDFTRTSGGLANQQRILSASFTDFKASLGQIALPLVTRLVSFLNEKGIPVLNEIKGGIIAFGSAWKFNDGEITSSGFPGFMERLGFVARQAFEYFKTAVLPRLREFAGFIRSEVVPRLVQFASYIRDTVIPIIVSLVQQRLAKMREMLGSVAAAIQRNKPELQQLAAGIVNVSRFLVEKLIPFLAKMSNETLPFWGKAIGRVIDVIALLVRTIGFITGATLTAIRFSWQLFSTFFQNILDGGAKAFGWVPGIGGKLRTAAAEFRTFSTNVNRALANIQDQNIKFEIKYTSTGVNLSTPSSVGRRALGGPGGKIHGPGGPKDDKAGLYALSDTEWVMQSEAGRQYGDRRMAAVNAGVAQILLPGEVGGFAAGGRPGLNFDLKSFTMGALSSTVRSTVQAIAKPVAQALARANGPLQRAMSFGRSQVGKPYVWGGVGPNGYDCSGFVSALINVAQGRSPYRRLGATGSMPWSMMAPGPGRFMVGWFKGNPGHTAASINGVPFESAGGVGVRVGGRARGAFSSLFTNRMHVRGFAGGGRPGLEGDLPYDLLKRNHRLRDELGIQLFDGGGPWRHGTLGLNMSGRTETVVPGGGEVRLDGSSIRAIGKEFARAFADGKLRIVGQGNHAYVLTNSIG